MSFTRNKSAFFDNLLNLLLYLSIDYINMKYVLTCKVNCISNLMSHEVHGTVFLWCDVFSGEIFFSYGWLQRRVRRWCLGCKLCPQHCQIIRKCQISTFAILKLMRYHYRQIPYWDNIVSFFMIFEVLKHLLQ